MEDPRTELLKAARLPLDRPTKYQRGDMPRETLDALRRLVMKLRDERVLPILSELSQHVNKKIACDACGWYARVGSASTADKIAGWLRVQEPMFVERIADDVKWAAEVGYAEKGFIRPVFEALVHVVRTRVYEWLTKHGKMKVNGSHPVYEVVDAMLELDPRSAWPILWSEDVFHIKSPALRPVVMYWTDMDGYSPYVPKDVAPPSADRLWKVYRELDAGAPVVQEDLRRATQAEMLCALMPLDPQGTKTEVARIKKLGLPKDDFVFEEARRLSRSREAPPDLPTLAKQFKVDRTTFRSKATEMLIVWNLAGTLDTDGLLRLMQHKEDDCELAKFGLVELGCGSMGMQLSDLHDELHEHPARAKDREFLKRADRFVRHFRTRNLTQRIERYASDKGRLFLPKKKATK